MSRPASFRARPGQVSHCSAPDPGSVSKDFLNFVRIEEQIEFNFRLLKSSWVFLSEKSTETLPESVPKLVSQFISVAPRYHSTMTVTLISSSASVKAVNESEFSDIS